MRRIVRLTESDLTRLVKRVINEDKKQKMTEDEKAAYEKFEYWLFKTGLVKEKYHSSGKKQLIQTDRLPTLNFKDGFNMSIQIYDHEYRNSDSVLYTFNVMYTKKWEEVNGKPVNKLYHESILTDFADIDWLGDNPDTDENTHYSGVTPKAIAKIVIKHGGIDFNNKLPGNYEEPGEAPPLSERYLVKTVKRIIKNNYY